MPRNKYNSEHRRNEHRRNEHRRNEHRSNEHRSNEHRRNEHRRNEHRRKTIDLSSITEELPPATENWDNDNAGTYDPMENSNNKIVVRCLIRASKAEKKRFRKSERLRILKLLESEMSFLNNLKQLTLKDDSAWEQISHLCQLTLHDNQISDEEIQEEFSRMKISFS